MPSTRKGTRVTYAGVVIDIMPSESMTIWSMPNQKIVHIRISKDREQHARLAAIHGSERTPTPRRGIPVYREPPEPRPLKTWKDRVTLGMIIRYPLYASLGLLPLNIAVKTMQGKPTIGPGSGTVEFLGWMVVHASGFIALFWLLRLVVLNWDRPVRDWSWK